MVTYAMLMAEAGFGLEVHLPPRPEGRGKNNKLFTLDISLKNHKVLKEGVKKV